MSTMEVVVKLRPKNQLTLPEAIAQKLGVAPGDRLVVTLDEEHPKQIEIRPIQRSYFGILRGVYGKDSEEIAEYIRGERAAWGE